MAEACRGRGQDGGQRCGAQHVQCRHKVAVAALRRFVGRADRRHGPGRRKYPVWSVGARAELEEDGPDKLVQLVPVPPPAFLRPFYDLFMMRAEISIGRYQRNGRISYRPISVLSGRGRREGIVAGHVSKELDLQALFGASTWL